jgi:hypothetical protein
VVLADTALVDARDANTGAAVGTRYVPPAIAGAPILVQAPATSLLATGTGLLPRDLTIGAQDVGALELVLRHPGAAEQGAIRCDSLTVRCLDPLRQPLSPAGILDRLGIEWDGVPLVEVDAPAAADGRIGLPLGGQELAPGESATLRLVIDVEAGAPATGFELLVEEGALVAVDANLESPLAVIPEASAAFPFSSGLTRLQAPADELVVGCSDLMPAALAADGREVAVLGLELTNPAAPGVGDIRLESVTLRAADADLAGVPLGAAAATVRAYRDGDPWAEATGLAAQDTLVLLAPAAPLVVAAGQSVVLELRLVLHGTPSPSSLRVGIAEEDIGVEQPHGALLAVRVVPAGGQFLPFWSEPGHLTDAGLAASYSNFPNPFAAGREATRFVYSLPQEARVTLRLLTARGETVVELLDEAWRGPGLHQDDAWDGRNGRGATVRNGVYVAELVARFADGSVERIRRKVAVVR